MSNSSKRLTNQQEATTRQLHQQIEDLRQHLAHLTQMVNGDQDSQFSYHVWTSGAVARCVAEIATLLSRQHTLQEAIHLIEQEEDEQRHLLQGQP